MPLKELYLHVGTHKTGTSALQRFFATNRKPLRQRGVVYPYDSAGGRGEGGHYRLWWSLQAERGRADERFPDDLRSYQQEWRAVLKQASDEKLLVSAEGLWKCAREDLVKIRELASDFHIKIVVFLRRQDDLINSVYSQITKDSKRVWSDLDQLPYNLDYVSDINLWAEFFGKDNIIIRPYERQQFYGSSLFSDFLYHIFSLELSKDFKIPEREVNAHLHRTVLEYKSLVNRLPLSAKDHAIFKKPLIEVSREFYQQKKPDDSLISPQRRLQILKEYAACNMIIAKEYLERDDGRLFHDVLPDINEQCPPYRLDEQDIKAVNEYFMLNSPSSLKVIMRGILLAEESNLQVALAAARRLCFGIIDDRLDPRQRREALEQKIDQIGCSDKKGMGRILQRAYTKMPRTIKKPVRDAVMKLRGIKS